MSQVVQELIDSTPLGVGHFHFAIGGKAKRSGIIPLNKEEGDVEAILLVLQTEVEVELDVWSG